MDCSAVVNWNPHTHHAYATYLLGCFDKKKPEKEVKGRNDDDTRKNKQTNKSRNGMKGAKKHIIICLSGFARQNPNLYLQIIAISSTIISSPAHRVHITIAILFK